MALRRSLGTRRRHEPVTDGQSGVGLSAVQVEVHLVDGTLVKGGFTAASGAYRITGIPAGTYLVSFTLPGWAIVEESDISIVSGQTTNLSVTMAERSFNLNPITVTASRRVEKALDAPAAVEVVTREDIAERPAVTPVDHVKEKAGVDFMPTGLQSSYTVVRGFNNVFSGSALNMTDFRIARVPSIRVNVSWSNPTTSSDIERAEVVLGPGSALYGPNAANGVVHFITRSPIDDPGMDFALSTGLRQQKSFSQDANILTPTGNFAPASFSQAGTDEFTWQLEGRLAWKTDNDKFGVKLSGSYFTGLDYGYIDPTEKNQQSIALACQALNYDPTQSACFNFSGDLGPGDIDQLRTRVDNVAGGTQGEAKIGDPTGPSSFNDFTARDPDLKRWGLDLRTDFRPNPETSIVLSGGHVDAINSVDLTGIGGGQVQNWGTWYAQGRFNWKRLFAQVFWNKNDNDQTYLLRSGRPLIDKSYQTVAQLQHGFNFNPQHGLTYGFDYLYTNPQSEGTINGRHEADDDVTEIGGYVQYDGRLSHKWNVVAAARLDDHTRLTDAVFSPRAAIVFSPTPERSIRASYNRAFSTPNTLNLFLDISAQPPHVTVQSAGVHRPAGRLRRAVGSGQSARVPAFDHGTTLDGSGRRGGGQRRAGRLAAVVHRGAGCDGHPCGRCHAEYRVRRVHQSGSGLADDSGCPGPRSDDLADIRGGLQGPPAGQQPAAGRKRLLYGRRRVRIIAADVHPERVPAGGSD
jgi:iron complex outermembrane receptor protein